MNNTLPLGICSDFMTFKISDVSYNEIQSSNAPHQWIIFLFNEHGLVSSERIDIDPKDHCFRIRNSIFQTRKWFYRYQVDIGHFIWNEQKNRMVIKSQNQQLAADKLDKQALLIKIDDQSWPESISLSIKEQVDELTIEQPIYLQVQESKLFAETYISLLSTQINLIFTKICEEDDDVQLSIPFDISNLECLSNQRVIFLNREQVKQYQDKLKQSVNNKSQIQIFPVKEFFKESELEIEKVLNILSKKQFIQKAFTDPCHRNTTQNLSLITPFIFISEKLPKKIPLVVSERKPKFPNVVAEIPKTNNPQCKSISNKASQSIQKYQDFYRNLEQSTQSLLKIHQIEPLLNQINDLFSKMKDKFFEQNSRLDNQQQINMEQQILDEQQTIQSMVEIMNQLGSLKNKLEGKIKPLQVVQLKNLWNEIQVAYQYLEDYQQTLNYFLNHSQWLLKQIKTLQEENTTLQDRAQEVNPSNLQKDLHDNINFRSILQEQAGRIIHLLRRDRFFRNRNRQLNEQINQLMGKGIQGQRYFSQADNRNGIAMNQIRPLALTGRNGTEYNIRSLQQDLQANNIGWLQLPPILAYKQPTQNNMLNYG